MRQIMRRILLGSLALVLLHAPGAVAQSCQGLASFSDGRLVLSGDASLASQSSAVGGGIAYGFPQGPFGQMAVASRSHDNFGGSSLDLGAAAGYQISFGREARVHLCPVLGGALELGPNNAFNGDVHRSRRSIQAGLSLGAEITPGRRWNVVPSFGLFYAYQRDAARDQAGDQLFQIDDYYTMAQLGLGLVFKSTLSIRPYVDLPLWLAVGQPSVGVTLGYSFGK
jgi:hypothetical protein